MAPVDLKQRIFIFEIEVDRLRAFISEIVQSQPIPKFPAVFGDITIHISKEIETQKLFDTIADFKQKLVEGVDLLDVFGGEPTPPHKKIVSMRVTYRSLNKTLGDENVHDLHKSITDRLVKAFNATLPG